MIEETSIKGGPFCKMGKVILIDFFMYIQLIYTADNTSALVVNIIEIVKSVLFIFILSYKIFPCIQFLL